MAMRNAQRKLQKLQKRQSMHQAYSKVYKSQGNMHAAGYVAKTATGLGNAKGSYSNAVSKGGGSSYHKWRANKAGKKIAKLQSRSMNKNPTTPAKPMTHAKPKMMGRVRSR